MLDTILPYSIVDTSKLNLTSKLRREGLLHSDSDSISLARPWDTFHPILKVPHHSLRGLYPFPNRSHSLPVFRVHHVFLSAPPTPPSTLSSPTRAYLVTPRTRYPPRQDPRLVLSGDSVVGLEPLTRSLRVGPTPKLNSPITQGEGVGVFVVRGEPETRCTMKSQGLLTVIRLIKYLREVVEDSLVPRPFYKGRDPSVF